MDVGFLSVVPPLLTIALAIITKEVLMSLHRCIHRMYDHCRMEPAGSLGGSDEYSGRRL